MADIGKGSGFVAADPSLPANPGDSELGDIGGGGAASLFGSNPGLFGALGLGGALVGGLLMGGQQLPYVDELTGIAQQAGTQLGGMAATAQGESSALINPLLYGQELPGVAAQIQDMVNQQTAQVKGTYARLGQTGSTMEASALDDIKTKALATQYSIAASQAQMGVQLSGQAITATTSELGIEAGIYENLQKTQLAQDQSMMGMIGQFAGAFAKVGMAG